MCNNNYVDCLCINLSNMDIYLCIFLQILQSIANHVLFTKEEHMRPFNDFVKSNFDSARR